MFIISNKLVFTYHIKVLYLKYNEKIACDKKRFLLKLLF